MTNNNTLVQNRKAVAGVINAEKNGKRDYAIDNLKGFLIILVILGHGGLLTNFKSPIGDFLLGYIYLFHMPLFFAASCLFIKEFSWTYCLKRFIQLMVPFFFFVIIDPRNTVIHLIDPARGPIPLLFQLSLKTFVKQVAIGSAFYLQNALWFLPTLFLVNILLSVLLKFWKNKVLTASFALLFIAVLVFADSLQLRHYIIPYGADTAVYLLPLMLIIRYIYIHKQRFLTYSVLWFAAGAVISSLLIIYFVPKNPVTAPSGRFDLAEFFVPDTLWGYIFISALSVSIFLFFMKFKHKSLLSMIGLYTMPIYLLHTLPWFTWLWPANPLFYLAISLISSVAFSIFLSKILMKISPRFKWIGMVA